MQAVSLDQYAGDLAVILAIDWLLDRCRTAINLLGDSYGVLVVDHLVKCAALPPICMLFSACWQKPVSVLFMKRWL